MKIYFALLLISLLFVSGCALEKCEQICKDKNAISAHMVEIDNITGEQCCCMFDVMTDVKDFACYDEDGGIIYENG